MTTLNITAVTTAELLAFFNANTGGAQVKKFADRKTAERRCQALADEMFAEENTDAEVDTAIEEIVALVSPECAELTCPNCGSTQDITNGRIVIRAGHQVLVDEDEFTHHGCGFVWGTPDAPAKKSASTGKVRPEMTASLKLDRAIRDVASNLIYANACQVWKSGLVSSSQCDRLSAVLYGAAKTGNRLMSTTVNGRVFTLANKA